MLIKETINKYVALGHNLRNAQNLAAEEIVLSKIASSSLSEHVTLKGGIVMFNLTKSDRRVTQDIDFDLIRYSIDEKSIEMFIDKLNSINDGMSVSVVGNIEKLHQEDYQGARVHLLLEDDTKSRLRIKTDIGVHTYSAIEQERIAFIFESTGKEMALKVNPCEQIFAEKLVSLARLGPISTRYKDIYDLYYLINHNCLRIEKVRSIIELFLKSSNRQPKNINELVNSIIDTLNNKAFESDAKKPASKWLDIDYLEAKDTIIAYISNI